LPDSNLLNKMDLKQERNFIIMKSILKILILVVCIYPFMANADGKINLNRSLVERQVNKFSLLANYSYIDLWIPSKYGLSLSLTANARTTYDVEYLQGKFSLGWFIEDLGSFSEQRLSILRRRFNGRNSFNFILGAYYSKTKIDIGSRFLDGIIPQANYDLLQIENLGITLGIGNRWVLRNGFTVGADWISVNIPVYNLKTINAFSDLTTNADDRENADDAIDLFKSIPGFVAIKVQLGYSF